MRIGSAHVILLVEEGVDDREFLYPYYRILEAGFDRLVLGSGKGTYKTKFGMTFKEDGSVGEYLESNPELNGLKGVIIPGGKAPERLRIYPPAVELIKKVNEHGVPIASICHGPQLLISADVVKGRKMTCYKTIVDDLKNAGAIYLDEPVVRDGNIVSSRGPDDIPYWMREFFGGLGR